MKKNNYIYKDIRQIYFVITHITLMQLKKYLPKKVTVIEVPINEHADNAKAVTDLIKRLELGEHKDFLVLSNDKIKTMRVRTKWF